MFSNLAVNVAFFLRAERQLSDDFDDLIAPQFLGGADNVNNIVQRNRRGQREVANLGNAPQNLSRLRSGRI